MLKPFTGQIEDLVFIHAHSGSILESDNRVYSISSVILGADSSKRSFSSNVKYSHFTERERYYSNLSKDIISRAPTLEEVKKRVGLFLKDQSIILVYNNHNNIKDILNLCGQKRVIDLCFALEFFLPQVESYSPKTLDEFLSGRKREKISYSSEEIAELGIELVEHICAAILNDQQNPQATVIRHFLDKSNTLFGSFFTHIAKNYENYFASLFNPCSKPDTPNWQNFLETANKQNIKELSNTFTRIKLDNIRSAFENLANAAPGHVFRSAQVEYALHITDALNNSSILSVEAGTGTGKTQGYLIPCFDFLSRNTNSRIAISTYTKSLQNQICQREIPFIQKQLKQYSAIPVAVLKGKSNYVCAEKLANIYEDSISGRDCLIWLYFLNILFNFRVVDFDSLGEKIITYLDENSSLRLIKNEISAKTGCSDDHLNCPAQVIVAEASGARLIVTNHYKLALLESDPSLAGLFKNLIIDEASHLENAVRQAVGRETSSRELADILNYLESAVQRISKKHGPIGRLSEITKFLNHIRLAIANLNMALKKSRNSVNNERSIIFNSSLKHGDRPISEFFKDLELNIDFLSDKIQIITSPKTTEALKINPRMVRRMKSANIELKEYKDSIRSILKNMSSAEKVTSYQIFPRHWTIKDEPVDIAEHVKNTIYKGRDSVILTSATLCDGGNFSLFKQVMGMERKADSESQEPEFKFAKIESPFPKTNRSIIVHKNSLNGGYSNKKNWTESVVEILPELIMKNRGRTLVLFASYDDLEAIANRVEEKISLEGYPVLIQKRNTPTYNLCEEFTAVKESVLFGVDTFWYGVDFKGDTLTQVIITRVPFPNPHDPIQIARKNIYSRDEYWNRYRFDTLIKLKQGIGRLIRSESDKGKIVILDSRYSSFVKDKSILPGMITAETGIEVDEYEEDNDEKEMLKSISTDEIKTQIDNDDLKAEALATFLQECCVFDKNFKEKGRLLHRAYCIWHEESQIGTRMARRIFWDELNKHNEIRRNSSRPVYFLGLCLKINPSLEACKNMFKDSSSDVKYFREKAFQIGVTRHGGELLIPMFSMPDYETRRRACSAAHKLRDKNITKHIEPCLHSTKPQIRQYALKAVYSSKCHEMVPIVSAIMKKEDKDYNLLLCKKIIDESVKWKT